MCTAGNKGQLRSQHIVSLETRQKKNKIKTKKKEPAELCFSCLFQLFSFFLPFEPLLFLSLHTDMFLFVLYIHSKTAAISCSHFALCVSAVQQPGGGFGFHQTLYLQHLRKQSTRETSSFQLFSPCLII